MITKPLNRVLISYLLTTLSLVAAFFALEAQAAESDVWTTHSGPGPTAVGSQFTITVGYGNNGPDAATSAYVDSYFLVPMGMDVFIDDLFNGTGAIYDAIQMTATGTDTLGNAPLLFWDTNYCEELFFQLQRNDGDPDPNPVEGLDSGVSATFSYDVMIPMDSPNTGVVEILEPAHLAQTWTPSNRSINSLLQGASMNAYGRGGCTQIVGDPGIDDICEFIDDNCFSSRVSLLDQPIESDWELVSDGSLDPTLGCEALVGFTPDNIAVVRRGGCEYGVKAFNAEFAGATGVIIVNSDQCSDSSVSDQCILNMSPGSFGNLVTIPTIMIAKADGEPVIAALSGGEAVRGVFGGGTQFATNGGVFLSDFSDTDPVPGNNDSRWVQSIYQITSSVFADGFESGDTLRWDQTNP